jgi:protein SCO1/2
MTTPRKTCPCSVPIRRALLASLAALGLLAPLPRAAAQPTAKDLVQNVGLDQNLDAQLPLDLTFRDEQGQRVRLGQYFGKRPVILTFVYFRCPMLCTQVLNGLLKSAQAVKFQMGTDYEIISLSIDPHETPAMAAAKKQRYAQSYRRPGADVGWHFLTGEQPAIEKLARVAGFRYQYDPASDQYAHASGIVLVTPEGRISRYFYGIEYHPTDLRLGLVESSANRIGSPVDQFLLLCFHYDPRTGKYGLIIENVIRLAGVVTVFCLGTFLWRMYRREKRLSSELAARRLDAPASPAADSG